MKKISKPVDGVVPTSGQSANSRPSGGQTRPMGGQNSPSRRRRRFGSQKRTGLASNQRGEQTNRSEAVEKSMAALPRKKSAQRKAAAERTVSEKSNGLRIIPLGGQEEVGRNMTVFEYGGDIVILDMGLQFPEEDMPGIDYIIPNISYLKGREKNIRGVILSHGHMDHIGAAPILLKKMNYPPIVGRDLTLAMVKKKLEDFEKNSAQNLKVMRINSVRDKIRLGKFEINFFDVEHSIMDAVGVIIKTPAGTVIHPGDWTMDKDPMSGNVMTYAHLAKLPSPRILMLESLGAVDVRPAATSEKEMYKNLEKLLSEAKGRVIIGTFSSQIRRIGHLIEYAEKIGKKVALDGYSMKMNVEIAKELGYIKAHKETLIPISDIHKYPDNRIIVICTGAQGEGNAVLSRIITDQHRYVKIQKDDTVIFSSSVIPGNERTIQRLKDNLYRKSDNVIHTDIMDVHTSGHSNAFDIKDILRQVKPDYFLPVYANHYMLKEAARLAREIGFRKENIFVIDNGTQIEFEKGNAKVRPRVADTSYVMVDGLGVGDIGQVVLRDRQVLAQDGMFTIVTIIDSKTKRVIGEPQVTSRGFIYVKENFDLVNATKRKVKDVVAHATAKDEAVDWNYVKDQIRDTVGQFLYQKTERRPMVLPVVIEV
ncbi:MAG TPA: ribonuclease J [Candidatus Bathyarchaeia archaeon]|nr:ribonuclease J [Candidatus Bathyarchaeia archaeon]